MNAERDAPSWVEADLYALSEILGTRDPDEQAHGFLGGEWGYGQDFANDVFEMFPFYWGDCTCGYDETAAAWESAHDHRYTCYQKELLRRFIAAGVARDWELDDASPALDLGEFFNVESDEPEQGVTVLTMTPKPGRGDDGPQRDEIARRLCLAMGLTYPFGSAVHCTCPYQKQYEAWCAEHDHDARCPIARPNFAHFASGVEVRWYKYIGRGMDLNRDVTREEWRALIDECESSLERAGSSPQ